jgi:hypothetical protein
MLEFLTERCQPYYTVCRKAGTFGRRFAGFALRDEKGAVSWDGSKRNTVRRQWWEYGNGKDHQSAVHGARAA